MDFDDRLGELFELFDSRCYRSELMDLLVKVWNADRRFGYSTFERSAELEVEVAHSWGLKAEVVRLPADGRTMLGAWRMPMAWDCDSASATVVAPEAIAGRKVVDVETNSCAIVMWSGPTPEGGLIAPVVHVDRADKAEGYEGLDVRGKIVLTGRHASACKMPALRAGAAAIVSYYSRHPEENAEFSSWVNAWSDDPDGWAFHADDTPFPGLSIPPKEGRALAELVAAHPDLRLRVDIRSRLYEGDLCLATAVLEGETEDELLVIGHGHEQGANDNASGVVASLGALGVIKRLIDEGRLPRPKRSFRCIVTNECYGTNGFGEMYGDAVKRMICGLNMDMVASSAATTHGNLVIRRSPEASAHFVDSYIPHLVGRFLLDRLEGLPYSTRGFALVDNGLADPAYGVPTVAAGASGDMYWHTNGDVPERMNVELMRSWTALAATFLYTVGTAGAEEAAALAEISVNDRLKRIATDFGDSDPVLLRDRVRYRADRALDEIASTRRLLDGVEDAAYAKKVDELRRRIETEAEEVARSIVSAEGALTMPDAAYRQVPVRLSRGSPTLDALPKERRRELPGLLWNSFAATTLFWCDGVRTAAEVARRAAHENGKSPASALEMIRKLAEGEQIEIRSA